MKIYALIGSPVGHSFSPEYFRKKFESLGLENDCKYLALDVKKEDLADFLREFSLEACNVTIPHKKAVIPYLADISEEARAVGAVNLIKRSPKGLVGYNTDVYGFEKSIEEALEYWKEIEALKIESKGALIYGNGGAAQAVKYVLEKHKMPYTIVYRRRQVEDFSDYILAVNTTPIGMYPNVDECLDLDYLNLKKATSLHKFYFCDLIYNPDPSKNIVQFSKNGAVCISGTKMFELQAQKTWEIVSGDGD